MHVTTSQCETSSKIMHINFAQSQSTHLPTGEKSSSEQAAFWLEVNVVCCPLTPYAR